MASGHGTEYECKELEDGMVRFRMRSKQKMNQKYVDLTKNSLKVLILAGIVVSVIDMMAMVILSW